jgi:hypothetical protein
MSDVQSMTDEELDEKKENYEEATFGSNHKSVNR